MTERQLLSKTRCEVILIQIVAITPPRLTGAMNKDDILESLGQTTPLSQVAEDVDTE